MAIAKKCDRCGKFYEHYPIGNIPGEYNAIEKVRLGKNGAVEYRSSDMDLCPDCMYSFVKFMKGSKVVEDKNNRQRNEKVMDIDISKYIKIGQNTINFTSPDFMESSANKGVRLYVELFPERENDWIE